jgi:hypothetical protein
MTDGHQKISIQKIKNGCKYYPPNYKEFIIALGKERLDNSTV